MRARLDALESGQGYFNGSLLLTGAAVLGVIGAAFVLPWAAVAVLIAFLVGWHVITAPRAAVTKLAWLQLAPYASFAGCAGAVGIAVLGMGPPGDVTPARIAGAVGGFACLLIILAWPIAWIWLIAARRKQV